MVNKLPSFIVERQHADDGEWTEHRLQAGAAAPHTRTTGGTAEGKFVCKMLQLPALLPLLPLATLGI